MSIFICLSANFETASINVIIVLIPPGDYSAESFRILKPGGLLIVYNLVEHSKSVGIINSYHSDILRLKLSGFCVKDGSQKYLPLNLETISSIAERNDINITAYEVVGEKPAYKVNKHFPYIIM